MNDGRPRPYFPHGGPPGSDAAREAARRNLQRGIRSVFIRARRAGITFVVLFAALVVYMVGFAGVGFFTFLLAMVAITMLSLLTVMLPVRDRRRPRDEALPARPNIDGGPPVPLDRLASQTEDWLLARCRALPNTAGPALDRIVYRLRDLQPALDGVRPDTPLGGEAQRLIGKHLPDLVTTYLSLPPGDRHFQAESSASLADSLGIVADQLDDLCERVGQEKRLGFDTERRFIETRYRDGDSLGSHR